MLIAKNPLFAENSKEHYKEKKYIKNQKLLEAC